MNDDVGAMIKGAKGGRHREDVVHNQKKPMALQSAAIPSISATRSVGFDTTSTRTIRVSGRIAAATADTSVGSARVVAMPKRGKSSVIMRKDRP